MAVLLLTTPDGRTRETPVGARLVMGRSASCDLHIDDERVSRRHAEVVRQGAGFILNDLGSRNGTRLNGRPVTSAPLRYGDEIGLGGVRLLFAERPPSELVGRLVAGYEVLDQIGSGGMGVVYRARQAAVGRVVALKVLHPRLAADRAFAEAFVREARAASILSHVNLVHIYDAGCADEVCFCVMEHVNGPSVAELLRTSGPIPARRAIDVALQVAAALAYTHKQGILHRDVKPENILLASDGTAKLADIGLAALALTQPPTAELDDTGKPLLWGTPSYMAPEVALGEAADPRSDLYSLGATLFHMVTGRAPFTGATPADVLAKHVGAPLPDLQAYAPNAPLALNPVIEKLMAKRRERRHASAGELIADLAVVREAIRQAASVEETRFLTPLPPARASAGATRSSIARLVAKWLKR